MLKKVLLLSLILIITIGIFLSSQGCCDENISTTDGTTSTSITVTTTSTIITLQVSTLAGPATGDQTSGDTDGIGTNARFNGPFKITSDGTNLYTTGKNHKIRKIVISTGEVTTLAGPPEGDQTLGDSDGIGTNARFYYPNGITTDGTNVYVADGMNSKIRKIVINTGEVTTFAGPPEGDQSSGDINGIGTNARFNGPTGITYFENNLYVCDYGNNKIRKIVISNREVTTLVGPPEGDQTSGDTDGIGTNARFKQLSEIISDGTNLYVTEFYNQKIRKIVISTGEVTTFAGPPEGDTTSGDADGIGTNARFYGPTGIIYFENNLYVCDNGSKIRKIVISTGEVTTFAGPPEGNQTTGDVDGIGTNARFKTPRGITYNANNLYVADSDNNKIRKISLP